MKPMCGFIFWWTAIGMFLMLFFTHRLFAILFIAILLLVGIQLFCSCNKTARMIGFILILLAAGMIIMLFLRNYLLAFLLIALFLFLGFRLFCC